MTRSPGDVGGQRTLRPYWRNYFEQTDALVWVVDSGDRMRMQDCKEELHSLLLEDVRAAHRSHAPLPPSNVSGAAASRCVPADFCKQAGHPGFDVERRNTRGAFCSLCSRCVLPPITHNQIGPAQALALPSIKSHQWRILPCSAVTGENLVEGLDWVVDDVANRLYYSSTAAATEGWRAGAPGATQAVAAA